MGFTEDEAEDLIQDVFLTFLSSLHRFEGRSQTSTWLFGILHHKTMERRRKRVRDEQHDPIDAVFESRFDSRPVRGAPSPPTSSRQQARQIRRGHRPLPRWPLSASTPSLFCGKWSNSPAPRSPARSWTSHRHQPGGDHVSKPQPPARMPGKGKDGERRMMTCKQTAAPPFRRGADSPASGNESTSAFTSPWCGVCPGSRRQFGTDAPCGLCNCAPPSPRNHRTATELLWQPGLSTSCETRRPTVSPRHG
ncbi:MAG: hypothetical protein IPJ98_12835 [Bryobacterales bacterium]|nr:hypothetical protein [Bryobacterales bacterium]